MSFQFDDLSVSHQLVVGSGFPVVPFRVGVGKVRGAASIEGPAVIGSPSLWPIETATLMVGPDTNRDTVPPILPGALIACGAWNHSPYSVHVVGDAVVNNFLDVAIDVNAGGFLRAGLGVQSQGDVFAFCGKHRLSNKKNFDIPHPTKEGWRLRHTCLEGPSNDVYIRGKIKNTNEIILPEYWSNFVDPESITVNITPIGAHQDIMVKTVTIKKIVLQSKSVIPINCFYHIFATRCDGDTLIPEYEGLSPVDYPGNNSEYTINS
jgi:hypothetical protein